MKTLLLTTFAISGLTLNALAQSTVSWAGSGALFIVQTNGTVSSTFEGEGGSGFSGGTVGDTIGNTAANNASLGYQGYYFELLSSTTASTAPTTLAGFSAWSDTGLSATNDGFSNGRIEQIPENSGATANNWPQGTAVGIIMVGWSANLGSTWATVLNNLENANLPDISYFGVSSIGSLTAGTANPGANVFGGAAGQINNSPLNSPAGDPMQLDVIFIPEPGTTALAVVGGALLLLAAGKHRAGGFSLPHRNPAQTNSTGRKE